MAITLTEKAARHVTRFLERRGKGIGLRFGV
ncbi:MAG: iron-sulfur cluster assembly protein IscA, partial [Oxalobacter sp.]|nr:iron-sulfur cluster assembly protein IscA [Oxalobacter sp.]